MSGSEDAMAEMIVGGKPMENVKDIEVERMTMSLAILIKDVDNNLAVNKATVGAVCAFLLKKCYWQTFSWFPRKTI